MGLTFMLTVLAWIFFRANTVSDAIGYISNIFDSSLFTLPELTESAQTTLILMLVFTVIEWLGREGDFAISKIYKLPIYLRWSFYFLIIILMFVFIGKEQAFIYFQF
jgi:hypothetical protein